MQCPWEPERNLAGAEDAITAFWARNRKYKIEDTIEVEGEHRCQWCCKFSETLHGHKIHCSKCTQRPRGRALADKTTRVAIRLKRARLAKLKAPVRMGHYRLKCVFDFTYLGHFFQADGDVIRAVEIRLGKAWTKFTQLRNIWDSSILSRWRKLDLYQSGVLSTLTHCHEVWRLNKQVMKMLGGFNAKCLSVITGKSIRDERVQPSVDLIRLLRVRRLRWLGHILRLDDERLLRRTMMASMQQPYPEGSILMDAPPHDSWADLERLAGCDNDNGGHGGENHREWSEMVRNFENDYVE